MRILLLGGLKKVNSLWKLIKQNPSYRFGAIATLILLGIILLFFGGSKAGANLSPYEVIGVKPGFTRKEMEKAYRVLAYNTHPDRHGGDLDMEKKHMQIQRAYEILGDSKKLENWEKYGNPNGPDSSYYDDKYPDFLTNPPKTFVYYYLIVFFLVGLFPVMLIARPMLKSPPSFVTDKYDSLLKEGEGHLGDHKKESLDLFNSLLVDWEKLIVSFPKWRKSVYHNVFQVRVAVRLAQYKMYDGNFDAALESVKEAVRLCDKEVLKSKEVQKLIGGFCENCRETAASCRLSKGQLGTLRATLPGK